VGARKTGGAETAEEDFVSIGSIVEHHGDDVGHVISSVELLRVLSSA
jgi:hypothetical protein